MARHNNSAAGKKTRKASLSRWDRLFSGKAIAACTAAAIGLLFIGGNGGPSGPGLERLSVQGGIEAVLERAGLSEAVTRLTAGDGQIDVLIASAADCSYCREMVESGLEPLSGFAVEQGLDLAFLPVVRGPLSALAAGVEHCVVSAAPTPLGVDDIQAIYRLVGDVEASGDRESLEQRIREFGSRLGGNPDEFLACALEESEGAYADTRAFASEFGLTGTPSFYLQAGDGAVFGFAGWPGADAAIDRIGGGI